MSNTKYDKSLKGDANLIDTLVSGCISYMISNNMLRIYKFELSLLKNKKGDAFKWENSARELIIEYINAYKGFTQKQEEKDGLLIAFTLLSCSVYHKVTSQYISEKELISFYFKDTNVNIDGVLESISHIWNLFNNILPIEIPLL